MSDQNQSTTQHEGLMSTINAEKFVAQVLKINSESKADAAKLRNSLSDSRKIEAWEVLIKLGYSISLERNEIILRTIASSIAKSKATTNGNTHFAEGLKELRALSESTTLHFRRLIACKNTKQVCQVLPRLLDLLNSKEIAVDYVKLMKDLIFFEINSEKTKARWAELYFKLNKENIEGK